MNAPCVIDSYDFGRIVINKKVYTSDLKITNGVVSSGWWRQSGHSVTIDDITDILDTMPQIIIMGQGKPGFMRVDGNLREQLIRLNITCLLYTF